MVRRIAGPLGLASLVLLVAAVASAAAEEPLKAPTRLHRHPDVFQLVRLRGDAVEVRYAFGSLDRAANLQNRFELVVRAFDRWIDAELQLNVYLLSRDHWEGSGYDLAYGLPARVGTHDIAAPAVGDDGTVALWSRVLDGVLPSVPGLPLHGTPQQAATMVLADNMAQLQVAEILVDEIGIGGDQHWVRGLMTHLVNVDLVRRLEPTRLRDLDTLYAVAARERGERAMAARDYDPELTLRDWLWYQAQFHRGAQVVRDKTGKGALKKMRSLRKKGDGVLRAEDLLRKFPGLRDWYQESFAAVSMKAR